MTKTYFGFWLSILVALGSLPVLGQGSNATINGRVTDSSGLTLVGAKITAVNTETGSQTLGESNEAGLYSLPNLQAGTYRVVVERQGFQQVVRPGVELHVADIVALNFTLAVGSVTQSVTVEGGAPIVETSDAALGGLVNSQKIADLPLNGRNYIDLSLLEPGVAKNTNSVGTAGTPGTAFSSNGAPLISNNYTLDGTPLTTAANQSTASLSGSTLGIAGIREFKVITNGFGAEYGMTMGSQMVMISKGGVNAFHGEAFEYFRNNDLDARNFFDGANAPPYHRNNFGGAFGGPIKKDKTFFYGVYEALRQNVGFSGLDQVPAAGCHGTAGTVIVNTQCPQLGSIPSVTIVNPQVAAMLALFPLPTSGNNFQFPTTSKTDVNFGQMRFDQILSTTDTFFARYTTDQSTIDSPNTNLTSASTGTGGVAFPQFRLGGTSFNQFLTASENHIFSPTLLNTVRLSFARTNRQFSAEYAQPLPPGLPSLVAGEPFGTLTIGGLSPTGIGCCNGPPSNAAFLTTYGLSDEILYTRGKHSLKFGTLMNRMDEYLDSVVYPEGAASYASLATFLQGIPSSFSARLPGADQSRYWQFFTFGFYAQDDWRISSRLTLNLGLRYEFNTIPQEKDGKSYAIRNILTDTAPTQGPLFQNASFKNFSPRLGLAWDPFGDGKTSIRSAFGIYYDVGNWGGGFAQNAFSFPPTAQYRTITNTGTNAVFTFPYTLNAAGIAAAVAGFSYQQNQPRITQFNLSVQRQLLKNTAVTVAYVGTRGGNLWSETEGNPTTPTYTSPSGQLYWSTLTPACAGAVPSCRLNPNFGSFSMDATIGKSWYNALQASLNQRLTRGLEFQAAYTWSHSEDTGEGQSNTGDCTIPSIQRGQNPYVPVRDNIGPSCWDLRQNFRLNIVYRLPSVSRNGVAGKLLNGWWVSSIVSSQTGFPFSPVPGISRSAATNAVAELINVNTATVAPGQAGPDGSVNTTAKTFIPFNAATVITGSVSQWYNPLMFSLQPVVPCPNNSKLNCSTIGNEGRGILRGPGLQDTDVSLVKDTKLGFLGEQGSLQFRVELFNVFNHPNFGMPSGTAFAGSLSDRGAYSEAPASTAGQITSTVSTSRQLQLALKIVF